jgi:hypothetical protein
MNDISIWFLMVLCLSVCLSGCSKGSEQSIGSGFKYLQRIPGIEIQPGATDVGADTLFMAQFRRPMIGETLTTLSYFIVKGAKADQSSNAYDASICDPTTSLPASLFSCGPSAYQEMNCGLEPAQFLDGNTSYSVCISPRAQYSDGTAFEGVTISFTTGVAKKAEDSCTDPTIVTIPFITHLPFDITRTRALSKFRSCFGYPSVDVHEPTPKSNQMHHVFGPTGQTGCEQNIPVYAPFDGTVVILKTDSSGGSDCSDNPPHQGYIYLRPSSHYRYIMKYLDVNPVSDLQEGGQVTAGQLIGYAELATTNSAWVLSLATSPASDGDEYSNCEIGPFLSNDMTAELQSRGVDISNLKFTKAHRAENECVLQSVNNTFTGAPENDNNFSNF